MSMAADSADVQVDVYINEREARKWGARDGTPSDMQSFAESFAVWKAESSREFSGLDIEKLLRRIRDGKTRLSVIGYNEFPYKKTWQIEREYWLAGDDGLIVLHVHYADKWHDKLEERGKCDVITQINLRHTVKHEAAVPGVNAYWTKCEDLDQWKELKGQPIFTGIPAQGWRWRQKVSGRWDNGFAPVVHDLLKEAEKCTTWVRAIKAVELAISPGARKALCIGVEQYTAVNKLRNAEKDAGCLKSRLQELRWSVDGVYNPGQKEFKKAIKKFANVVKTSPDACLFAFVGHGVELQGEHFFLPADFELEEQYDTESLLLQDLKDKAVAFSYLEECVQAVRQKPSALQVSLFVLDCCRSSISALVGDTSRTLSSFPQRGGQSVRSSTTIENSFVIYSTSKGSTAGDGAAGRGGPFMGIFTEEMMVPGSIQEVMMRTRTRLLTDECQLSPEQSTLTTSFSFCPITNSPAAAASQGSDIDADLVNLLTKWGLKPEADRIAGLGVREPADMAYVTEEDIDSLGLLPVATRKFKAKLRVLKEAIAKKLIEADLSGQSTDEAGSESEDESERASPLFAAGGHGIAAYSPDNLNQFRASVSKVVVVVREVAVEWLQLESGGNESRHPFCATVLLDVLRHTGFKQNTDIAHANEWFEKCVQGNMCLSGDVLEGFQSVIERGSLPTELLQAEASSGNAKQHRRCVALIDAAVRLLHQQSPWGDVAEWNRGVVDGWFTTSEGAVSFLDKAEAYLRRYVEPEKLNLKVMEGAVETGSFVAFFLADRFTQMLVFAVIEYRRASEMARHAGMDAERRSAGDGTLGGFCFFASSTGRACDLRGERARCQLRGSPAVVAMLQFMSSLPVSQSLLLGGEEDQGSLLPAHAAADKADLKLDGASDAFTVSRVGVLDRDETQPAAVAVFCEAATSVEVAPVSVEVNEGKGKDAKNPDALPGDADEVGGPAKKNSLAKDVLGECGGMPEEEFVGDVDQDFLCGICSCVMVEPRSCREGHLFCFRCILQWLARKKTCPIAREPLTESDLCNIRFLQQRIEKLPMRCPTAVKIQVGVMAGKCQWTGVLAEREGHLKECRHHAWGDFDLEELGMLLHEAVKSGDVEELRALLAAGAAADCRNKDGRTTLHLAADKGHAEVVKVLVEAGADKEAKAEDGWTPLHYAAGGGHAEVVKGLVEAGADKEAKDKGGLTPLHFAAMKGHAEVVKGLVEAGADKEAKEEDGLTPLHFAAINGHGEAARALVEAGADKEAKQKDGLTPLHFAASNGHGEAARALVEAGADKEAKQKDGYTPLHLAAGGGRAEVVKGLVEAGADKEAKQKNGYTPLHRAVINGHAEAARALVEAGADKEAKDKNGGTPLHLAADNGHAEAARALVEAGADKEAKDKNGGTPLHLAADNGHAEAARALVEAGADKEAKDKDGQTPLHWAAYKGQAEAVKGLVEAGADKEAKEKDGSTPLHWAAGNGHAEAARALVEAGADKEAKDKNGGTPLHSAAVGGHVEAARALVEAGADKEAKDKNGGTPLHSAAVGGHVEAARALVEAGADKEAKDKDGCTPLHYAVGFGHAEVVKGLVEAGADKEAKDKDGSTPLHWAAGNGHAEAARALVEAGADKEAKDKNGGTPLHSAAVGGHVEAARALVEAGADKEAKDKNGCTPLHYAVGFGHAEVVKGLVEAGADKEAKDKGRTPLQLAVGRGHAEVAKALVGAPCSGRTSGSTPVCDSCGAEREGLKQCVKCKLARYCNAQCQTLHWKEHKPLCKKWQKALEK